MRYIKRFLIIFLVFIGVLCSEFMSLETGKIGRAFFVLFFGAAMMLIENIWRTEYRKPRD